jgi:hypothetical protein
MPMTGAQRKLERARYLLQQAKSTANKHDAFIANLDAFVTSLNSVIWDIMINEFNGVPDFNEWFDKKGAELHASPLVTFFREKRRLTEHIEPFEAEKDDKSFYTTFNEEFRVPGGSKIGYPLIVNKKGLVKPDDKSPILMNDKPTKIKRRTSTRYYFKEYPAQNVFVLCDRYFNLISDTVDECHAKFKLSDRKKRKKV